MPTVAKKKSDQFEEALKKLQSIVEKMERGDLPLDEAMEQFSEGIRLARICHQRLEEAEQKVRTLLKEQQGGWTTAPFDPSSGGTPGD
jgi:exodeoxyribonuclease VII small subunit